MIRIHVFKEPDGWRAAIETDDRLKVLPELFDDEVEARLYAASLYSSS
jgi:cupin superfamily acireductone dioxygenase involved in methionine salvage